MIPILYDKFSLIHDLTSTWDACKLFCPTVVVIS